MRAALVSVDYADLLAITLPLNRKHFSEVMVVTTPDDAATIGVAQANDCRVWKTNRFYDNGAAFAKWRAFEEGLDWFGRHGWMCLMDADVLWPSAIKLTESEDETLAVESAGPVGLYGRTSGVLLTPLRRMCLDPQNWIGEDGRLTIQEINWTRFPLHPQQQEWAGYTQIFHASDLVLGPPPWHEVNWRHAGGADSMFQAKWPTWKKFRPPFEVLHLGAAGKNWCGRATPYLDGTVPEKAGERQAQVRDFIRRRTSGPGRFNHEKT